MSPPVVDRAALLEPLKRAEGRLAGIGRVQMAHLVEPIIERLGHASGDEARVLSEAALAFCRRLYADARSAEALPLARAVLAGARRCGDLALQRRAATACGVLAADTADIVGAVEHHVAALRLAADDPVEASGVWNNIGLAMGIAGNYEMAARCYKRCIELLEDLEDPAYARYAACMNLAMSQYHNGAYQEGLYHAHRALHEEVEAFRARDPQAAVFLRRDLVRLLVALGRVREADPHVTEIALLADRLDTPRSRVAAATTRATYEIARGQTDVALTRLENALAQARRVPAALRDTLVCVIHAEEAAGHSGRALLRLGELSEHVYRSAVERTRQHVELAGFAVQPLTALDFDEEQSRARLVSRIGEPVQPEGWAVLQRLSVSAVMRRDKSGWHGKRVGALSKALALASGLDPLHALELGLAAEVHDIGLLCVPEEILRKKGPLSDGERAIVRRHVDAGVEMLSDDSHPRVFLAREIARYHHARWDGAGYPEAVAGKAIPFAARVCAVADAYDAMMCGLGSRPGRTMDQALGELRREAGRQFDPELVRRFEELIRMETEDLGVDLSGDAGMDCFQDLVQALEEDRGFV